MCGRVTRDYTWRQLFDLLNLEWAYDGPEIEPSYNVAPTQNSLVLRASPAASIEPSWMRWGLIPGWAKDDAIGSRLINARSETVAEKPAFRSAFKARRCIVPISGFYEWQMLESTAPRAKPSKQPWYIVRADALPMLAAGLWERRTHDSVTTETFTILTTSPNAFMARLHDRMPVILEPPQARSWISCDTASAHAMMQPAADGVLTAHPVSTRVNNPKVNDASLTQRLSNLFE
jgi:putative SOS response-associated peptidase YedK